MYLRFLRSKRFSLRLCAFASNFFLLIVASACADHKPAITATAQPFTRPAGVLRVCSDPNNLPFSNDRGEGFENKIAELLPTTGTNKVIGTIKAGDGPWGIAL